MASDQVTEPRRPGTDGPVPDPQGAVIPCLVECLEVAVQPAGRFDLRRNGRLRRREDGRRNSRGEQGARDAGMKKGQPCRRTLSTGTIRRSEEHTSELQSLMRNSYAVFCLKKKNKQALSPN